MPRSPPEAAPARSPTTTIHRRVSIGDATIGEGGIASFPVTLSAASGLDVTVGYSTSHGTTVAADLSGTLSGSVTITAGLTSASIPIQTVGDALDEDDETFTVTLSGPVNATLGDSTATGTITDDDPLPQLSISDAAAVTEGGDSTFTISLSPASGRTVTVNYSTASGTAASPGDFDAVSNQTVTFTAGDVSEQVVISTNDDATDEATESYNVTLSSPSAATIADGSGAAAINDNDGPSLSIDNVSVNEGAGNAVFTVTPSAPSPEAITVQYTTANGTAVSPGDFTGNASPLTLTIPANQPSGTISIPIVNDSTDELDETFLVNLANATNATIADSQGQGTIVDNDGPTITVTDQSPSESAGSTVFTVSLSGTSVQTVTVQYETDDGTATSPVDYTGTSSVQTLTFTPGQTSKSVPVPILEDAIDEANETFLLNLSNPTNASFGDNQGLGTIVDNDGPAVSIGDATITEGASGTVAATFTLSLSASSPQPITVNWATANGTAAAPSDYLAGGSPPPVTFVPGDVSETVTVQVNGDTLDEADETFFVNLSGPTNATLGDGQGLGTITDDDPLPALSISNAAAVTELDAGVGSCSPPLPPPTSSQCASFTVTLSAVSGRTVTVAYATAPDTATTNVDFSGVANTLSFAPGETAKSVLVPIRGDNVSEANETFLVNLSGETSATLADGQGVGTIADDDPQPTLTINDAVSTERERQPHLHGHALVRERAGGQRQLRDRRRDGHSRVGLPGAEQPAPVQRGTDLQDDRRAPASRHARRGSRDLPDHALEPVRRDDRGRLGYGHDHRRRRPAERVDR